jgi:hypothetical protein
MDGLAWMGWHGLMGRAGQDRNQPFLRLPIPHHVPQAFVAGFGAEFADDSVEPFSQLL